MFGVSQPSSVSFRNIMLDWKKLEVLADCPQFSQRCYIPL